MAVSGMMSPKRFIVVCTLLALAAGANWYAWTASGWETATIELDLNSSIQISRKHSHPFLAEYHRKVRVIHSGRKLSNLNYPKDTGGGFPMQVRFYANPTNRVIRFTDHLYDRLIDLHTGKYVEGSVPPEGKELSSYISEVGLPPLKSVYEITRDFRVSKTH